MREFVWVAACVSYVLDRRERMCQRSETCRVRL
jgi:hypothetical protein